LKGLATGVSVVFATALSTLLFGTPISGQFVVGATMILCSVYVFSNPVDTANLFGTNNNTKKQTELQNLLPK
jgi:drug/metabolite transporter (DMT)-like permease